jgi:hypothetical protein
VDVISYNTCRLYSERSVQSSPCWGQTYERPAGLWLPTCKRICHVDLQGSGVILLGLLRTFRYMLHAPSKRQESVNCYWQCQQKRDKASAPMLRKRQRLGDRKLSDTSKRSNGAKWENNALLVVISEVETQCGVTRADVQQSGENAACFVAFRSCMMPEMVCPVGLHICFKMAIVLIVSCKGEFAQCTTDSDVLCRLHNTGCWSPWVGCLGRKGTGDWRKLHNKKLHDLQC